MADLISTDYKRMLQYKHDGKPWGGTGEKWVEWVLPLLNDIPLQEISILDFGCGRGTFKPAIEEMHPGVRVTEYDPGVRGKDVLEMVPVDYVVCTDVMEHVEQKYVVDTLRTINWLAIHGVFFNIDTALSKSFLPDGRNTHITIHPSNYWKHMLSMHIPEMVWTIHEETETHIVISGKRKKHVE